MAAKFYRDENAQALVEGCIGLVLMTLTLMLVYVFGFQVVNRERCLLAARHAAWIRGNGQGQLLQRKDFRTKLASSFFHQTDIVKFETEHKTLRDQLPPFSNDVTIDRVLFGMTRNELSSRPSAQVPFPLSLMRVKLPIVYEVFPDELVDLISQVSAECAWYEVGDSWEGWGSLVKGGPLILVQGLYNYVQDKVMGMIGWT